MPLKVSCPNCSKELHAPDELVGQLVACPRCSHKFQVAGVPSNTPAGVGAYPPLPTTQAVPPSPSQSASNLLPPGVGSAGKHGHDLPPPPASGGASSSTANLERISLSGLPTSKPGTAVPKPASQPSVTPVRPLSSSGTVSVTPVPPEPPRADVNHASKSAVGTSAAPPAGQQVARFKGAPPVTESPQARPAKRKREVKQARFVASGAVATRINLGEDGQLPNLVVSEAKDTTELKDQEKSTSPLLMIAVLVFSVLVSVVMLLAPEKSEEAESTSKQKSTEHIETNYIGSGSELKPYQKLLREGLQAQRRGDEKAARFAYREVLGMLRAETSGEMGLTAPKWADPKTAPNDSDLEKHLNVLLADD